MKRSSIISSALSLVAVLVFVLALAPTRVNADGTTIKGWISDAECGRGRASSGLFTGTNPDCAKKCIASGKKMVLIVPDQRIVLTVMNPNAAKVNIGDFVEITGSVEMKTKTVRIGSLKMLKKGVAMCGVPAKN